LEPTKPRPGQSFPHHLRQAVADALADLEWLLTPAAVTPYQAQEGARRLAGALMRKVRA
jgi:hypothetical protein